MAHSRPYQRVEMPRKAGFKSKSPHNKHNGAEGTTARGVATSSSAVTTGAQAGRRDHSTCPGRGRNARRRRALSPHKRASGRSSRQTRSCAHGSRRSVARWRWAMAPWSLAVSSAGRRAICPPNSRSSGPSSPNQNNSSPSTQLGDGCWRLAAAAATPTLLP